MRVGVCNGVAVEETTYFGVVVARLQEVQAGFAVVIVTPVPERIEVADMVLVGDFHSRTVYDFMISPCVVPVLYHFVAVAVNIAKTKTPRGARAAGRKVFNFFCL